MQKALPGVPFHSPFLLPTKEFFFLKVYPPLSVSSCYPIRPPYPRCPEFTSTYKRNHCNQMDGRRVPFAEPRKLEAEAEAEFRSVPVTLPFLPCSSDTERSSQNTGRHYPTQPPLGQVPKPKGWKFGRADVF